MDRKAQHQANLLQAARANGGVQGAALERREQIIEALKEGRESHSEIARRFGTTARSVSKIKMRHMNKPSAREMAPEVVAAEQRLAQAERRAKQERLILQAAVYEAKAAQCLREARELDDD